jgi:hypothetical protein
MLNKRKSDRRKIVLSVKISVDNATSHLAHTVDITSTGARLVTYRTPLQAGMIVGLQRGAKKKKFLVQWIKQLSPNELQAGIECLESQNDFWGIELTSDVETKGKSSLSSQASSRVVGNPYLNG